MRYTVGSLIEALAKHDPELPVSVDGYEWGYTRTLRLHEVDVTTNEDNPDYAGELEDATPRNPKPTHRVLNIARHDPDEYDDIYPFAPKDTP